MFKPTLDDPNASLGMSPSAMGITHPHPLPVRLSIYDLTIYCLGLQSAARLY